MKTLYTLLFLFILAACKKEKKAENLVIQAMVNGQWKVTNFTKSGVDKTIDFASYKFQFETNFTVDAINNGTLEKTGSWNADASAQTITSNFFKCLESLSFSKRNLENYQQLLDVGRSLPNGKWGINEPAT